MNDEVRQKYTDVGNILYDALNSAKSIELEGEEENVELIEIKSTLKSMNESFKEEIDKLEFSSEWDKFCMAYFGETNAGKSTLIDSLRIIYNDESRFIDSENTYKNFKATLKKHSEEYETLLAALKDINIQLQNSKYALIKRYIRNGICAVLIFAFGILFGIVLF